MIKLSKKSEQISGTLRRLLLTGEYPPGEKLPSAKELARKFKVSNNVILKAIQRLNDDGLVETKRGRGGTRSLVGVDEVETQEKKGMADAPTPRFLIGKQKRLRVRLEDHHPSQIAFWEEAFAAFHAQNPDIELIPEFGMLPEPECDIAIGGFQYMHQAPDFIAGLLSKADADSFGSVDYSGCLLQPRNVPSSCFATIFPIMFHQPILVCRRTEKVPEQASDVIEFIRQIRANSGKPARYRIWNYATLMANRGIDLLGWDLSQPFAADDKVLLRELRIQKDCYGGDDLLWFHGSVDSGQQAVEHSFRQGVRFLEMSSANRGGWKLDDEFQELPYPFARYTSPIPICVFISGNTSYPAEAMELIRYLLHDETQEKMMASKIALPLKTAALQAHDRGDLVERFQQAELIVPIAAPPMFEMYRCLISWELYYFLNGRRDEDVIELLRKKIQHYLKIWNGTISGENTRPDVNGDAVRLARFEMSSVQ